MGCTVMNKPIRANRRSRSMKSDPHHSNYPKSLPESAVESGTKLLNYMGNHERLLNSNHRDPGFVPGDHHLHVDDCGLGFWSEEQLEELLLKNLEFMYNEAICRLVGMGYNEDVALKAILLNGHCSEGMDGLSNILHNSLTYLNGGCCGGGAHNEGNSEERVFTDLRQLEEYSLAGMVCLLQQLRPHLTKWDAMWCLLLSNLHVGRARTIEIPLLPSSSKGCTNPMGDSDAGGNGSDTSSSSSTGSSGVGGPLGPCKFPEGWGSGYWDNPELPVDRLNQFFSYTKATFQREIACPKGFNLSPSVKSLKRNVAASAARFWANSKLQMQTQGCIISKSTGNAPKAVPLADSPVEQSEEPQESRSYDAVNSVLNKLRDLNLNESLDSMAEDEKDEILFTLMNQVKGLEQQVNERKEWAHQKAMQAARKLSSDLTELRILRMDREETLRLIKGKHTLEDSTIKRLSEMENALGKASSQVDRANVAMRQFEVVNAEIRAEMEASKLSASESATTCLEVAKREKKWLKRLLACEKHKTNLHEEIAAEKQKISDLQQQLVLIYSAQKEAEVKWKEEIKAKELAMAQLEEERRAKDAAEASNKSKLEALRLKIEIDFQCHKDDLQRLEQELVRLKSTIPSSDQSDPSDSFPEVMRPQGETIPWLLRQLDELNNSPDGEVSCGSDRECTICKKEEVSVVFLPCAHQVTCASCGEGYGKKEKSACPCCGIPIEQRIRVFGASS